MDTLPVNTILQGDCREVLSHLPANSVDLIYADPPYFLQLTNALYRPDATKVHGVTDLWDVFSGFAEYDLFTRGWLTECRRVLKPTGTLFISGSYHNIFRVGAMMQDMGFWILNDICWVKANPLPQMKGTRLCNAHESVIWASQKQGAKYTFHYKTLKASNEDNQLRSDWYIPVCGGKERLRDKEGNKRHSTQKPEALLYRIITMASNPGDVVLDPFVGSGTSAAVAKKLGRNYIGIDTDAENVAMSEERLAGVTPLDAVALNTRVELLGAAPVRKVKFASLVENGYLQPGQTLTIEDKHRCAAAMILADATLVSKATLESGEVRGSIHQVGKALLGWPSCNGWEHWKFEDAYGVQMPIDVLRKRYLADTQVKEEITCL